MKLAESLDRLGGWLSGLAVRGWMILGLVGLAFAFVTLRTSPAALAIGLGGTLLAQQALAMLVAGVQSLANAMVAFKQIAPLYHAAARQDGTNHSGRLAIRQLGNGAYEQRRESIENPEVIVARELDFRYRNEGPLILEGCNLQSHRGDRVLLEGPSGGGKS